MAEFSFSTECIKRCPELQACAAELVLRQAMGENVSLSGVVTEHQEAETLPEACEKGPVGRAANLIGAQGAYQDIAQATNLKIDAWGDLVSVRCRAQGEVGGGNIKPISMT